LELEWKSSLENIPWQDLSHIYRVGLMGDKKPLDLETAFSQSRYRCFVFESGMLIGAGRALADGVDCSFICDVAVLPAYQGLGIGKSIVSRLVILSKGHKKIILYAAPGKETFYRKLGFKHMTTAMAIFENQTEALDLGLVDET
jgi:ribosomal protein S18 acetylase RimI-like enzyme